MALEGIDTSVFQGSVDWDAVRRSGRTFALTKATEGVGFIDPTFTRNWSEMLRVGLSVPGAYHFARPDLGNSPQAEADFFLSVVLPVTGSVAGTLLALDLEVEGPQVTAQWAVAFEQRLRERVSGYDAGFYSFFSWLGEHGVSGVHQLAADWLWLAWPDVNGPLPQPAPWPTVSIQQYGITTVPGIGGNVDVNRFFGDLPALRKLAVELPTATSGGTTAMAAGQCLYLNGVNHLFLLGSDGVVKWASTPGGAGGFINRQTTYVNVPSFTTDIRDIWVSQDRGPARPDGTGDVIDRILLFAAFGDTTWAFCVLNPTDASYKILDWSEPLPNMGLRARVPMYQGQVAAGTVDTSAFARQTDLDALRNNLHRV